MKAFNFLKLCRSTNIVTIPAVIPESPKVVLDESDEDDNDSCFDLDITSFDYNKENTNINTHILEVPCDKKSDSNIVYNKPKTLQPKVSSDRRKIIPIDPHSSRPQSPIAVFKASPSFWFKKAKSMEVQRTEKTQPERETKVGIRKSLSDNFKLEDVAIFRREYRVKMKQKTDDTSFMQKYLNFFKPGNEKIIPKKKNDRESFSGYNSAISSPASYTPRKEGGSYNNTFTGIRMVSRSKTPRALTSSPVIVRSDDSAREKQDGIQGAIMHCKQSFNILQEM